jgi:hypothetical protein
MVVGGRFLGFSRRFTGRWSRGVVQSMEVVNIFKNVGYKPKIH